MYSIYILGPKAGRGRLLGGLKGLGGRALANCMPTSTLNRNGGSEMLWEGLRDPPGQGQDGIRGLEKLWRAATALVKEPTAALSATVAGQLVAGILNGELVVIGELLTTQDTAQGKDDDVLLALHMDDTREAVGLT